MVDASIAVKWYLHEPGAEQAASLLTSASLLVAPALIRLEVTGAILRRYREDRLSLKRAQEACDLWEQDLAHGALRLAADDAMILSARTIALEIRHALADCLYLAVAVELGATRLVTADSTFHARAKATYPFIDLQVTE